MSQGAALEFVLIDETSKGDDPIHLTCCEDEGMALCGADLTDVPWVADDDPNPVCQLCERLDDEEGGVCEDGLCDNCPLALFGRDTPSG